MENIDKTSSPSSNASWLSGGKLLGMIYLLLNLIISVAAQAVLKAAMAELGGFDPANAVDYFISMLNPMVIGGLLLYGSGTILWLLCLTKLDLSFAYPAATLQYFLVFWSAWYFLGESIGWVRIAALCVITVGVIIMSLDKESLEDKSAS